MLSANSALQFQQSRLESFQFVFSLDPQTLLTIDVAAPVANKATSTFRTDVTRRPGSLPKLTRIGRRVFVRVSDLLAFISPDAEPVIEQPRHPGRPTKAEQIQARKGGAL